MYPLGVIQATNNISMVFMAFHVNCYWNRPYYCSKLEPFHRIPHMDTPTTENCINKSYDNIE